MYLTTNFKLSEFACKDGTPVPKELMPNVQRLATNLQVIRDYIHCPIHILSGYRTPSHNKSVGGAKYSQHLQAKASDLRTLEYSPADLYDVIEFLISKEAICQGGLGLYSSFVHYDVRGTKARW